MTVLQRRKTEEKNIFAEISVPNPYTLCLGRASRIYNVVHMHDIVQIM